MPILPKNISAYLGYTTQFFSLLLVTTYIGYWIDKRYFSSSLCIWIFPTLAIIFSLFSIVRQMSKKDKK